MKVSGGRVPHPLIGRGQSALSILDETDGLVREPERIRFTCSLIVVSYRPKAQ